MSKFKVNQEVIRKSDDKEGVVRAREVKSVENYTQVKYLVDFGGGIEKWQVCTRKDIMPEGKPGTGPLYQKKVYNVGDGKKITMVARVDNIKTYNENYDEVFDEYYTYSVKGKVLKIGFSVYNGTDEYNPKFGEKIAVHRCKTRPFTTMVSDFSGEFNDETVEAIMDVKAKYIISNIDRFYNKG